MKSIPITGAVMLLSQVTLVSAGVAALAVWPPSEGRMMLVPLSREAGRGLVAAAVRGGARLVEAGSMPGSMIVSGNLDRLAAPLLGRGILVIAAPRGGCAGAEASA